MNRFLAVERTILAGVACALSVTATADDWPFFRGPSYNGVSRETGWQTAWPDSGPVMAWEADVGVGASSVTVVGDRVVTMGNREDVDTVRCYHADNGSELWAYPYACKFDARMFEGGTASTPTLAGGRVYVLSYEGQFRCLDLETGQPVWSTHLVNDHGGRLSQWAYSGSPLVLDDMVIIDTGGDGTSTLALDRNTGEKRWAAGDDRAGYASPVPFTHNGRKGVLVFKAKHLVALALENGKEIWRIPWETNYDVNASTPIYLGETLFVSSGYSKGRSAVYQLTGGEPRELWQHDELKTKMSSAVALDGHVYGITEKKARLLCLNLDDGAVAWEQRGFGQYGSLLIAGRHIIALTDQGEAVVVEADPAQFTETARAKVLSGRCWVNPVLAHGRLYCKNNDGRLVALDLRPEAYKAGANDE